VKQIQNLTRAIYTSFLLLSVIPQSARCLDLDWSGQFRTESHLLYNYAMGNGDTALAGDPRMNGNTPRGYFVPGGGSRNAFFQTMFLRLRPAVIVNDNVYIKSEWWVGDPIYSFYGSGAPGTVDQRQYNSTFSRGSSITAQRVWGEFLTDLGTIQAGRMPLHWGLGVVWNNGNGIYDRYMSTGDAVRLSAKFGSFTFAPALVKYNIGNNIGGACPAGANCYTNSVQGGAAASDISFALKYENPDENMDMGVNFVRRLVSGAQAANSGLRGVTGGPAGSNFNTWDIYGRKTIGPATLGIEVPVTNGSIGTARYKTFAIAFEGDVKLSDSWNIQTKAGHIPGQGDSTTATPDSYKAFYFHPAYKVGLIMFNYQFQNFAGPNTQNDPTVNASGNALKSPYDNPMVNAKYVAFGGAYKTDKWNFHSNFVFAKANEVAGTGTSFFNTWSRSFETRQAGTPTQDSSLGWEMDYGTTFRWDDSFRFDFDFGWFFPGSYYKFTNSAASNSTSAIFAMVLKAGVSF
jgi:hypothetical protein